MEKWLPIIIKKANIIDFCLHHTFFFSFSFSHFTPKRGKGKLGYIFRELHHFYSTIVVTIQSTTLLASSLSLSLSPILILVYPWTENETFTQWTASITHTHTLSLSIIYYVVQGKGWVTRHDNNYSRSVIRGHSLVADCERTLFFPMVFFCFKLVEVDLTDDGCMLRTGPLWYNVGRSWIVQSLHCLSLSLFL